MTKFILKGKYKSEDELPQREHEEGSVAFKEPESMLKLSIIANGIAVLLFIPLFAIMLTRYTPKYMFYDCGAYSGAAVIMSLLSMFVHEYIHGIFMPGEVYMYDNLKMGLLFVTTKENMSKWQFIIMSFMPTLILGVIPFAMSFVINGKIAVFLRYFGIINFVSGSGDFINIFNSLTQMPKGSYTYLYGTKSFWFMPKGENK